MDIRYVGFHNSHQVCKEIIDKCHQVTCFIRSFKGVIFWDICLVFMQFC